MKPGTVVSTRIEPPLHPDGPEKILHDCGIEPEEFDEQKLFEYLNTTDTGTKPTRGIFAPWSIYKEDFQNKWTRPTIFHNQKRIVIFSIDSCYWL